MFDVASCLVLALFAGGRVAIAGPDGSCAAGDIHEVREGDTLWFITRRHYVCTPRRDTDGSSQPSGRQLVELIERVHELNDVRLGPDPNLIYPHETVCLPRAVELGYATCTSRASRPSDERDESAAVTPREPAPTPEPAARDSSTVEVAPPDEPARVPRESNRAPVNIVAQVDDRGPVRGKRKLRFGVETQMGVSHPVTSFLYSHVHSVLPSGSVALRVRLPYERLKLIARISGGGIVRQTVIFNGVEQKQSLVQVSGVGEVWIRFAGQRRVEGHVGLGAGVLWFRRELERADLPIPDPELQVMTTFTGVTALRGEFAVGKRRRSRLLLTAALNSIAMKIDETWKYVPQLGISGGFAHEF